MRIFSFPKASSEDLLLNEKEKIENFCFDEHQTMMSLKRVWTETSFITWQLLLSIKSPAVS